MSYSNRWGFTSDLRGIDNDTAIPYTDVYGAFGEADSSWYKSIAGLFDNGSVFVEIGSFEGKSAVCLAESIFKLNKQITLHCVDPFTANPEQDEYDYITANPNCLYDKFNENTGFYQKRKIIVPHRDYSNTICNEFADNSVDFVFIDARHEYEFVLEDIRCWYPKLKSGGIMSGHDYRTNNVNGYGVDRAVQEFCEENNIKYSLLDPSSASTIFIMDRKNNIEK